MISINRRGIAALGIVIFVGVWVIILKLHQINGRVSDAESSIDGHESQIQDVRDDVDDLQSKR